MIQENTSITKKNNYFMVVFGSTDTPYRDQLELCFEEGLPNPKNTLITRKTHSIFILEDKSGDETEETLSLFYRKIILSNTRLNNLDKEKYVFFVKKISSAIPLF